MGVTQTAPLICSVLLLGACKLVVEAPEGGQVVAQSGNYYCAESVGCVIEVSDTSFDEVFTAVPSDGYIFSRWADGSVCPNPASAVCALSNTHLENNPEVLAVIASDQSFTIHAVFERLPHSIAYFAEEAFVALDSNGVIVGDAINLTYDSTLVRVPYTDTDGIEQGIPVYISHDTLSASAPLTLYWDHPSCGGDHTHMIDARLVPSPLGPNYSLEPLFSRDYFTVSASPLLQVNPKLSFVRVDSEQAQEIQLYTTNGIGQCVPRAGGVASALPVTVIQKNIKQLYPPPYQVRAKSDPGIEAYE